VKNQENLHFESVILGTVAFNIVLYMSTSTYANSWCLLQCWIKWQNLAVGKKVGKKNRTTQICMIFKLMTHFTYNEEIKALSGKQTLLWQEFIMYWLSD